MNLLLDTHIFLWYISDDPRLRVELCEQIRDPTNEVYLSIISLWEIIIKHKLGKLPLPGVPAHYIPKQRKRHQIANLDLDEGSVILLERLPPLHRDPFDRMLICQALEHNFIIVTVDDKIRAYPVQILDVQTSQPGEAEG
jgi:PIN domain nuclease of toxin-antitoxin system